MLINRIIGLGHKKGTGKDTVANYLVSKWGFKKLAFADILKQACKTIYNLNDDQLYGDLKEIKNPTWNLTPRELFQITGTSLRESIGEDIWIKAMFNQINSSSETHFVISDVRMPNEFEAIKSYGGINCLVSRNVPPNEFSNHISETALDGVVWPVVFDNNSTLKYLFNQVDSFMETKL